MAPSKEPRYSYILQRFNCSTSCETKCAVEKGNSCGQWLPEDVILSPQFCLIYSSYTHWKSFGEFPWTTQQILTAVISYNIATLLQAMQSHPHKNLWLSMILVTSLLFCPIKMADCWYKAVLHTKEWSDTRSWNHHTPLITLGMKAKGLWQVTVMLNLFTAHVDIHVCRLKILYAYTIILTMKDTLWLNFCLKKQGDS